MDTLYFKTTSRASVLSQLGLYDADTSEDQRKGKSLFNGHMHQGEGFLMVWLGRQALKTELVKVTVEGQETEIEQVTEFSDYELFNVFVEGQEVTNRIMNLKGVEVIYPKTPNLKLL